MIGLEDCEIDGVNIVIGGCLNKDDFTKEELHLFDEFFPYYIHTYTSTTKNDGEGMKLIQIITTSFHYNDQIV